MARSIDSCKLFNNILNQTKVNAKKSEKISSLLQKTCKQIHNSTVHSQCNNATSSSQPTSTTSSVPRANKLQKKSSLLCLTSRIPADDINSFGLPFNHQQSASFSVSSSLSGKKKKEKCKGQQRKTRKAPVCPKLPDCLKFVRPPGKMKVYDVNALNCGRICMPCCPPARFPPICYFPHVKEKCEKKKNPRPAFSECPKDCMRKVSICDCCSIKPPPCRLLPNIEDEC